MAQIENTNIVVAIKYILYELKSWLLKHVVSNDA